MKRPAARTGTLAVALWMNPFAPAAHGQEIPAGPIIVTGERAGRTVRQTPSSVFVATWDELESVAGADRIDQVLADIPNVQLGSGGEGPTIRGQDSTGVLRDLPAFLGGNRPRVTLQVDGRAISYNEFAFGVAPLWDVNRVEVFRSPQTTTQGRNSIAGAIFVETHSPTFAWEAAARMVVGEYATRQASAMLSGPLVADQLAVRMTGDARRARPSSAITSAAAGADPNEDRYELLRAKLLATPAALSGLRAEMSYSHTRSNAPQFEGVSKPFRLRRDPLATYGIFSTRVDAATLRAEYGPGSGWTARATLSGGRALVERAAPAGFGVARNAGRDLSSEVTLAWRSGPALDLLLGAGVIDDRLRQRIDLSAALLGVGKFRDRQRSLGLFGEGNWRPAPRLQLTLGGRYQRDSQDRAGALAPPAGPITLDFHRTFSAFLPKLALAYEAGRDWRLGVLVQRAYNPGGTTLERTGRSDEFGAERLWAYEAFARGGLADGAVDATANVFHYAIRDAQRSLLRELPTPGGIVTFAEIANAPRARSSGAELGLRWRPSPTFSINVGAGLLRTRLTQALTPNDPLQGKEFQRAPHFTGRLAVDWRPLPQARLSAQARHNSGYFSDDANDPVRRVGPATTVDVRGEWRFGTATASVFLRNLFDKFYLTYLFAPASRRATAGDPREVGVAIAARF